MSPAAGKNGVTYDEAADLTRRWSFLLRCEKMKMAPMKKLRKSVAGLMVVTLSGLTACAPPSGKDPQEANANASSITSDPHQPIASESDQAYVGDWKASSAMMAGKPFPDSVVASIELKLTDGGYEVNVGGQLDKGTCEVDRTTTPNRMKITGTDGPNAGKTILAIVDFPEPGKMRVAYDLSGNATPQSFDSTAENGYYVAAYTKAP